MAGRRIFEAAAGLLLAAGLGTCEARAAIVTVTSREALGANDLMDWGTLGPNGTGVPNPSQLTSAGGLGIGLKQDSAVDMQVLVQGDPDGWAGNFSPGDSVLWTNNYPTVGFNAIYFEFDTPVAGFGANIQQVNALASFRAWIEAYDTTNTLILIDSRVGVSNANNDGSALFLGVLSSEANISRGRFFLTEAPFNYVGSYGINQLGLVVPGASPVVPEPSGIALVALAGLTLGGRAMLARRRLVG